MTRSSRKQRHKAPVVPQHQSVRTQIPTVASLGMQARLVPTDLQREHEMVLLITRYQRVCREWDRLVQQARALLGSEVSPDQLGEPTSPCDRAE
ncbi:hypothetical protein IC232_07430 [Microvirga sp. BT688]|uniref:hypothetical protein n=1 Tax=Microvirga sp. TaxID=1873136 RepID=UPI0016894D2A|nr:hypothetical protein [Microvirga sp.]MBD2746531.1 hypothetical protein [Microvirga sp.]